LKRIIDKCAEHLQYGGDFAIDLKLDSAEIDDVTLDRLGTNQRLILEFFPDIRLVGIDLWLERHFPNPFGTWGGIYARILEQKAEKGKIADKRCIQYLFIYTRQLSTVSIIWWILTPFLLGLWFHLFPWMDWWIGLFVFLPLPLLTLWSHHRDPTEKLRPQSTSLLPAFWLLITLKDLEVVIWGLDLSVFSLFAVSIVFAGVWILDRSGRLPTGHEMDYIPIFVWIRRREGATEERIPLIRNSIQREISMRDITFVRRIWDWEFDSVAWDINHYVASKKSKEELIELARARNLGEEAYLTSGRRVHLLMDNQWHSLRLGRGRKGGWTAEVLCKLIIALTPFGYLIPWSTLGPPLSLTGHVLFPFLFVGACCFLAAGHFKIHPRVEWRFSSVIHRMFGYEMFGDEISAPPTRNNNMPPFRSERPFDIPDLKYLDHHTLQYFWNLRGTGLNPHGPRLVIVGKMQNPFKYEDSFTSFRDDSDELYREIKGLQERLKEYETAEQDRVSNESEE